MRIHRIKLTDFRGVKEAEVSFPEEGVTIIEGENEVGKTSISEAIDLVLLEKVESTKKNVKAVQPVGQDVGSQVEIEMSTGPYHFVYRKQWHKQRVTELEVLEPHKMQLSGTEAHDKVHAMLEETLDRDLWEALRLRQGTELHQATFAGGSLGRALDAAAGGDTASGREDDLWERITEERNRYWTSTGQPKVERVNSGTSLAEAEAAVAEYEGILRSLDEEAEEVDRLVGEALVLEEARTNQLRSEAELAAQFEGILRQRNEVSRLESLRDTAQARQAQASEISKGRRLLKQRATDAEKAVATLEAQVLTELPTHKAAIDHLAGAQQRSDALKIRLREVEVAQRLAADDRDYRRQQIEVDQLSERYQRVIDALGRRVKAESVIDECHVSDVLLKQIEAADLAVATATAAVETGVAKVHIEAINELTVTIDGQSKTLLSGEEHDELVTTSLDIEVPGQMKIRATAGAGATALADRLQQAQVDLRDLCATGRVAGLAEARQVTTARVEAERVLVEVSKSIKQDLRDLTTESLAQKVEGLTGRIAHYEAERVADPPIPVDYDEAQLAAAELEAEIVKLRQEHERLNDDLAAALTAVQEDELGAAGTRARLEQAQIAEAEESTALAQARSNVTDEAIEKEMADTEAQLQECVSAVAAANSALASEDPTSVEELLNNARFVLMRLANDLHANDVRTRELRTRLALKGEEGLANKLDTAKSDLAVRFVAHEQLEIRAAAARLLYNTFARRRAEAHHRYIAPFRDGIEELGRLVFGPTFEVELDGDLRVARRTLQGVTLDFSELSTGAKEQMGMISRLACAAIVSAEGGAPVIFDDALGWSDPRRLERMGAVISKAGRSCQIIVLTCTPGRYASVGHASVVQLSA